MATLGNVRGAILEEVVLHLLGMVGYRVVLAGSDDTRAGPAGLLLQGRGEWHQIDALAAYDYSPAFMYPLRLLLEAKCYERERIGLETVRNVLGTLTDVSQNYFSLRSPDPTVRTSAPRYNFLGALFSTSGFTEQAQRFAIAHQIFLIQYERVPVLKPVVSGLLGIRAKHLRRNVLGRAARGSVLAEVRSDIHDLLGGVQPRPGRVLAEPGLEHVRQSIIAPLAAIRGSYVGMLQGSWPVHLLSTEPFPHELIANSDIVQCRVVRDRWNRWSFQPLEGRPYAMAFDLPEEVAATLDRAGRDRAELAVVKQQYLAYMDVSGVFNGIRRQIRLEMDRRWFVDYVRRHRRPIG